MSSLIGTQGVHCMVAMGAVTFVVEFEACRQACAGTSGRNDFL